MRYKMKNIQSREIKWWNQTRTSTAQPYNKCAKYVIKCCYRQFL